MKIQCGSCDSEYEVKLTAKFMKPSDVEFCCICGEPLDDGEEDDGEDDV